MPEAQYDSPPAREERTKRQERAERILDAAAELIIRWGYNKTTIDDIAKKAGVAKGTIYLHWKTREDLFRALMEREALLVAEDIRQRTLGDPEGGTLHGMIKNSVLSIMKHPLTKAVYLNDTELLGQLAKQDYANLAAREMDEFVRYFEILRSKGLMRTDISIREQIFMVSAISMGFIVTGKIMPDEYVASDEEAADMLGETIRRTFEPRNIASPQESQELTEAFTHYLDRINEIIQEDKQQKETES